MRTWRSPMSTPLMRVLALNARNTAWSAATSRSRMLKRCLASTTIERPSGVSSAIDASWATSASCCSVTPGAGRKAEAWRLPSVMVPVLSSSRTSTSPAASTARPDVAMTFAPIIRLIPATPIDDRRAPMVVGIRHTSSAISTVTLTGVPAPAAATPNNENGSRVTVTTRNTMVSATSRIVSAISFGVFWRLAPSTIEIMRSRKVSPGLTVTRTTSHSDRTRVPPVTAEKSPPDSRMTGADSPVIALSSTEATPSITSPSIGTTSPASTRMVCPLRRSAPGTGSQPVPCFGVASLLAMTACLRPRSDAAWALLRPSASASAKLANRTVNHSHTDTARMKPLSVAAGSSSDWKYISVVRMLPT